MRATEQQVRDVANAIDAIEVAMCTRRPAIGAPLGRDQTERIARELLEQIPPTSERTDDA